VGTVAVADEETLMLPGKAYTPEDVLRILRKRVWIIVVPWAVVSAATAVIASLLPDMYRSTALIQVVPPQVPESIVRSLNPVRFDQRLQATQQTVLSRTRLEAIIKEFNLYRDERMNSIMEVVVEKMRKDIRVQPQRGEAFTVTYVGTDPVTVWRVTERLAGHFKDESVRTGELRAEGTNSFVESAVEAARLKLVATEQKLKDYKMRHSGELPTQLAANMSAIQNIQMNLNAIAQTINNDSNAVARIERDITALEAQTDPAAQQVTAAAPPAGGGTAAQRLAQAKTALTALQTRGLKSDHPDLKAAQSLIRSLEKEANEEALRTPVGAGASLSPAEQARLMQLASLRDELDVTKKRIATNQAEETRLRGLAATYQAKVDGVPTREAELVELTREYETLNRIHTNLVAQREAASMSVNLERRQIGEQFNLIDPARLPEQPYSPNRLLIGLAGLAGGLAVGLGIVVLLEYRDRSFKADYEVVNVLALPVLAVVPFMQSDAEKRLAFRRRLFLNLGLGSCVAVCLAVLAYTVIR
jgi:polysaccharide chain length determinant protein (PEP-CTERM system associated)